MNREAVEKAQRCTIKMLSYLETLDQVEAPSKFESLPEVVRSELIGGNFQPLDVDPRAIDPKDVLATHRAPSPEATRRSRTQHRGRSILQQCVQDVADAMCRPLRRVRRVLVKEGVVAFSS